MMMKLIYDGESKLPIPPALVGNVKDFTKIPCFKTLCPSPPPPLDPNLGDVHILPASLVHLVLTFYDSPLKFQTESFFHVMSALTGKSVNTTFTQLRREGDAHNLDL